MNAKELKIEMLRHDDTGESLSEALGINRTTLSRKLNDPEADFTQKEIAIIIKRYSLNGDRIAEIFFANEVS